MMDFSSVLSLSNKENIKYLPQVLELVSQTYASRNFLTVCAASNPTQASASVGRDIINDILSGRTISCIQLSTKDSNKVASLMSVKPYICRRKYIDEATLSAKVVPDELDRYHAAVSGLKWELDTQARAYCKGKSNHANPVFKAFLEALEHDQECEDENNFWVVETGRAISTKDGPSKASMITGQWCLIQAWRRGAKFAVSFVNDNGLQVALGTGGQVLASVILKESKSLQRWENESLDSPRLKALNQPLRLGRTLRSKSDDLSFPAEFFILFDLVEQSKLYRWKTAAF